MENKFEKHLPNLYPNLEEKEKSKKEIENRNSRLNFLKKLGRKALPYFAAASTLIGVSNNVKAQSENKKSQNQEYIITGPDGKQRKFSSLEEELAYAKTKSWIVKAPDGTIYYPDGKVVKNDGEKKENKEDTTFNLKGRLIYHWPSPDNRRDTTFDSEDKLINFIRSHNNIFDPNRAKVEDENGNKITLAEFKKLNGNFKREEQPKKSSLDLSGKLTYFWPSPDGTKWMPFNSIVELKNFVKLHNNVYDERRIKVTDIHGNTEQLSNVKELLDVDGKEVDFRQEPKQDTIITPNNPKEDQGLDITKFVNKFPKGKGNVIQIDENGGATMYKVKSNKKTTKIRKKGNFGVINVNNPNND